MPAITKLLIANRGEIALRVRRTAEQLGIPCAHVFTEHDAEMPHADGEAVLISDYLDPAEILRAASETGANAIHPGYGFLSENPEFVRKVVGAGLIFIGPTAEAMEAVGDKSKARSLAHKLDIPTAEGLGPFTKPNDIAAAIQQLGLPVMLKAAAGGGGKGMKRIESLDGLEDLIKASQRETKAAFADDRMIVERFIHPARHVEVQIFGDGERCIALGERECSLQRRHQKIIEESPSTAVNDGLRERLFDAARRIGEAVGYRNAGTVEFLVGKDGSFYFLEVNARLQVEHPVTEMCTGLDLVKLQLRLAQGEPLPEQEGIRRDGHAIELRLNAEDPYNGFLPTGGKVLHLAWPASDDARVDGAVGPAVGTRYDSMIAKIIVSGNSRKMAIERAIHAVRTTYLAGMYTNLPFLRQILESDYFQSGETYIDTIDSLDLGARPVPDFFASAAAAVLTGPVRPAPEPIASLGGWRLAGAEPSVERRPGMVRLTGPSGVISATPTGCVGDETYVAVRDGLSAWVCGGGRVAKFTLAEASSDAAGKEAVAPMTGKVVALPVKVGQSVSVGDTLAVLEAMKMEYRLEAEADGDVEMIGAEVGELVDLGHVLVRLK